MVADSAAAVALLPPSVTEVVADKVYAIGGTIPAQQSLTWSPRRSGWLPIQCYLFQDGAESLLIDTGVAVHRAEVMRGIAALLGGRGAPRMTMTRWEPDSIINLPSVLKAFEIRSVVWSGPLNPLDFFEGIEKASIDGHLQATTGVALQREPPGSVLKLGDLRLEIVKPTMNVLATYWFYETETRTLLTSDSFGYLTSPTPGGPQIAPNAARDITTEGAAAFLRTKFDWMIGIDTAPLQNELLAIMRARPVDRICPGFGCIIEGPAAVAHAVDRTIEAMKLLSRERRASVLAGFDWSRAGLEGSGE